MKKIFFAFVISAILTGCGKYENESVSIAELGSALSYAADLDDDIYENLADINIASRYGIALEEIEGGAVYRSDEHEADELVIVKAQNHDALRNVETALKSELNDITAAWKYDAEERTKTEQHILKTRGMYVLMAVTDEPGDVERVFNSMVS